MKKYWQLFITFARIGLFTIGGGYAMLPMMQSELVERHGWATEQEMMDYYALAQCTPGAIAVNVSTFIGYKIAGVLGGVIAAPQLCGLLDTILRSLRDEPGFWWATYRRAWKRNARASLLPGAICGLLLATQIFTVFHYDVSAGVVPGALLAVGLFLLLGLGEFLFAQVVLLELPFAGLVKNSLFLFLGYLPRAALGVVWQFVYWIIILLLWPISGFAMVLTGLWLPAVLTMQAIYPVLNKAFDLERQIKAIRDAELDSSSDSDN